jgi:hypothetical protein
LGEKGKSGEGKRRGGGVGGGGGGRGGDGGGGGGGKVHAFSAPQPEAMSSVFLAICEALKVTISSLLAIISL